MNDFHKLSRAYEVLPTTNPPESRSTDTDDEYSNNSKSCVPEVLSKMPKVTAVKKGTIFFVLSNILQRYTKQILFF